jgi:hypothetical protein
MAKDFIQWIKCVSGLHAWGDTYGTAINIDVRQCSGCGKVIFLKKKSR